MLTQEEAPRPRIVSAHFFWACPAGGWLFSTAKLRRSAIRESGREVFPELLQFGTEAVYYITPLFHMNYKEMPLGLGMEKENANRTAVTVACSTCFHPRPVRPERARVPPAPSMLHGRCHVASEAGHALYAPATTHLSSRSPNVQELVGTRNSPRRSPSHRSAGPSPCSSLTVVWLIRMAVFMQ